MLFCESLTLDQAEAMTGLPSELIETLVNQKRIPGEVGTGGELYVGKHALLGWCRVYARILSHVAGSTSSASSGYAPFELVWMSRNGMLGGNKHARA
jgi:hypothetical protein